MVKEGDNIIGFGLMVKSVDFDLSFLSCGSLESLKLLIVAFGQCLASNFSEKRHSKELFCDPVFLTLKGMGLHL